MAYRLSSARIPTGTGMRDYVDYSFVLPTSKGSLTGLGQAAAGLSGTTLAVIGGAALAVWYFWLRKK